ncbi:MAG: metal ABC transporter solute-binding protein, Zn/Mn family [Gemmatimonadota bacterium]
MQRVRRAVIGAALLGAAALLAAACAAPVPVTGTATRSRVIYVVASENFWGSIARQLGGSHVSVYSIVSDPNADPHSFESSATSARAVAEAGYVIENGAGYDDWISQLMAASPNPHRRVLSIAALLGKHPGDNPHFWYDPAYVTAAENRIEADLKALDPADSAYFTARRRATDAAFAGLRAQLARIRRDYAGQPVASTESIVVYLARYLRLRLISPPAFMTAVSEGNEPPAAAVAAFEYQLATRQPRVLLYNEQTATALTTSMRELASRDHIPVAGVTETIQPPQLSYQQWLSRELTVLQRALAQPRNGGRP